jgi:lysophospholipase L1-like esterase
MRFLTWLVLGLMGVTAVMPAAEPTGGIVLFGDSTTAARQGLRKVYADHLREALTGGGADLAVVNAGVGGNTTREALNRLERDALRHRPRLLVLQFGINDSAVDVWKQPPATTARVPLPEYLDNLRAMVHTARTQRIQVILMTPNPLRWTPKLKALYGKPPYDPATEDGFESATLRPYVVALRQLATELKLPLVDVYAAYPAFAAQHQTSMDTLLLDGMHPNDLGHQLVAEQLLPVIQDALR